METRAGLRGAGLVAGMACVVLLLLVPSASAATCSNEAIRAEQGPAALALPDCRAYELVSPGSIPSLTIGSTLGGGGKASTSGNAVSYFSRYPAAASLTSNETWLSKRGVTGWTVEGLGPQFTPKSTKAGECQPGVAVSETLDTFVLSGGGDKEASELTDKEGDCEIPEEELVDGEPRGLANLYRWSRGSPFQLINAISPGQTPANATFQTATANLSHVVFNEKAMLSSDAAPASELYLWAGGGIRAIGILPSGLHVPATLAAATKEWGGPPSSVETVSSGWTLGLAPVSHAMSADGERVFFQAEGNLYMRDRASRAPATPADCRTTSELDRACTLQIDRSFGADPSGGGVFQFASRDGSRVFFTSDHKLTSPAGAQPGRPDLYEFDVTTRKLTNLTGSTAEPANVRGFSGGSDDGSHLYFVARGVLTGMEQNGEGESAQAGEPNLYLAREGALTFVATLSSWTGDPLKPAGKDRQNWWETAGAPGVVLGRLKTAWSPSGRYLVFSSYKPLTGFDNTPAAPGLCAGESFCEEIFLYDAANEELSCVSCDPNGANPVADSRLEEQVEFQRFSVGPRYAPRNVFDTGQVFFDTANPLIPGDSNGVRDVYEYHDGSLALITSGTGLGGSAFIDVSATGQDVFFATPEALVRRDADGGLPSVYDARINGGIAEPAQSPPPCGSPDSCRVAGPPPQLVGPPPTVGFTGRGNVKPKRCKGGKVLRGGRCVKKKKSGKAKGKTSRRSSAKQAARAH